MHSLTQYNSQMVETADRSICRSCILLLTDAEEHGNSAQICRGPYRRKPLAKPEWGSKRSCSGCEAKYYDFHRDPIICPKCGEKFTVAPTTRAKRSRAARPEIAANENTKVVKGDDEVVAEIEDIAVEEDDDDVEDDALLDDSDDLDDDLIKIDTGDDLDEKEA